MKKQAVQALIDACACLMKSKPIWAAEARVTCAVCLPNLFSSEVCIYFDAAYFKSKVQEGLGADGVHTARITENSLATDWGLSLPQGVAEVSVRIAYDGSTTFSKVCWMFGEVHD